MDIFDVLTVILLAMKLGDVGTVGSWPWYCVLAPLGVKFGFVLLFLIVAALRSSKS